jgi:hypothetical protein
MKNGNADREKRKFFLRWLMPSWDRDRVTDPFMPSCRGVRVRDPEMPSSERSRAMDPIMPSISGTFDPDVPSFGLGICPNQLGGTGVQAGGDSLSGYIYIHMPSDEEFGTCLVTRHLREWFVQANF